jgi:hypothetical protein
LPFLAVARCGDWAEKNANVLCLWVDFSLVFLFLLNGYYLLSFVFYKLPFFSQLCIGGNGLLEVRRQL